MRDPLNSSHADSNHYALPLAISPVVTTEDLKVIRIDIMPTGEDHTVKPTTLYKIKPPNEYTPEHQQLRTDLKPLNVVQPEGASFKVSKLGETGETIEWQKWSFRVGFNAREGMVLYDVRTPIEHLMNRGLQLTYQGTIRWPQSILPTCSFGHEHPLRRPTASFPQKSRFRPRRRRCRRHGQQSKTGLRLPRSHPLPRRRPLRRQRRSNANG